MLYEANLSDRSLGSRSDGSINTSITDRSNRRSKRNKSRKQKKNMKWPEKEGAIEMISNPTADHHISCVDSPYDRLIEGSKNTATLELPDYYMDNIEEGLVQNPMMKKGHDEGGGGGGGVLKSVRTISCDGKTKNMNKDKNKDENEDLDIDGGEDEKDEEADADADADIQGIQGIQGVPCQPPQSDDLDMNYLSFSSSSSALHSGSSSYEHRGLRTNSRDDGSDDVLDSAEEGDTDTDVYTETSSSKLGASLSCLEGLCHSVNEYEINHAINTFPILTCRI